MENTSQTYTIDLDGHKVDIKYSENPFGGTNEIGLKHFEFRGIAISETGYYSHFFHSTELGDMDILEYAKSIAIDRYKERKPDIEKEIAKNQKLSLF